MARTMNPSTVAITRNQIGKLCDLLMAGLTKSGLLNEPTQLVIEEQGVPLVNELVAVIRRRVEAVSHLLVRRVKVNRARDPQAALAATGRQQYTNPEVVATMPRGEGEEVEVVFFKPDLSDRGGVISDVDLEKEYERRGLKPADPYSLAAVNEADSAFADTYPNGTHWKNADGEWCFATFLRWHGERRVRVDRHGDDWDGRWGFAGLRPPATPERSDGGQAR